MGAFPYEIAQRQQAGEKRKKHPQETTLKIQWRWHPDICRFLSLLWSNVSSPAAAAKSVRQPEACVCIEPCVLLTFDQGRTNANNCFNVSFWPVFGSCSGAPFFLHPLSAANKRMAMTCLFQEVEGKTEREFREFLQSNLLVLNKEVIAPIILLKVFRGCMVWAP